MVIRRKVPRYPRHRQGPSCMLVLLVLFIAAAGITLIINADTVREAIIPTATPEPTRNAVDLAARADRLRRDGQIDEAISLYEAAVTQDGNNVRFYPPLVDLLVLLERGEEAAEREDEDERAGRRPTARTRSSPPPRTGRARAPRRAAR